MQAVLIIEELRIGQAGTHHAGITGTDFHTAILGFQLRNQEETVHQAALFILYGKILLILLHGKNQALLGHLQKFFFKAGLVDNWPFGQRRHFVDQIFRHNRFAADGAGPFDHIVDNLFTTLGKRRHHLGFGHHLIFVTVGRAQRNELMRVEAVTASQAIRL